MIVLEFVLLALGFAWSFVFFKRLKKKKESSLLLEVFFLPLQVLVYLFFLLVFLQMLATHHYLFIPYLPFATLRKVTLIGSFVWIYFRLKRAYFGEFVEQICVKKNNIDRSTIEFLGTIFTSIVGVASFFALLQLTGIDIVPFVTFGGIGLAAVGFASKDLVSNLFAGFMLQTNRPFQLGDEIEVLDKKVKGKVKTVGWYSTLLIDDSRCPVYVPNSFFSVVSIKNLSRMTHRSVVETFAIASLEESQIQAVMQKTLEQIGVICGSDLEKSSCDIVHVGPTGVQIEVIVYLTNMKTEEFLTIKRRILLEIQKCILES